MLCEPIFAFSFSSTVGNVVCVDGTPGAKKLAGKLPLCTHGANDGWRLGSEAIGPVPAVSAPRPNGAASPASWHVRQKSLFCVSGRGCV